MALRNLFGDLGLDSTLQSILTKLSDILSVDTGLNQPLTDDQLRASPVVVDTGLTPGLTDAELRNTPVPVTGAVNTGLSQPLTDTQLRATAVPISDSNNGTSATGVSQMAGGAGKLGWLSAIYSRLLGTLTVNTGLAQGLTDTQLRASAVAVTGTVATGGLTDTQLRATPVPVSGAVNTGLTQPLTDTQLRATAVPISNSADGTDSTGIVQLTGGAGIRGWLSGIFSKLSNTLNVNTGLSQPLTDTQLRATPVPVSSSLPAGAATEVTLSAINAAVTTTNSLDTAPAMQTRPVPQKLRRISFARVVSGAADPAFFDMIKTGTGQTVNQTASNLVMTLGTTAYAETIIRSKETYKGCFTLRAKTILSQRIVNNNSVIELVDRIADNAPFTINSATSITVDLTGFTNPFTAANIGQSMYFTPLTGTAGALPGYYAISGVSGNLITFTVAGFPASGSGTAYLYGWNYYSILYTNTVATQVFQDSARLGWKAAATNLNCAGTASPGHVQIINQEDGVATWADYVIAPSATTAVTYRGSISENIPDNDTELFLQIRMRNGAVAPVSNTTWTMGFISMEDYNPQQVSLTSIRPQSVASPAPVKVSNTVTVNANQNAAWSITPLINAASGSVLLSHKLISAATTNLTLVKATAGRIAGMSVSNTSASWRYLKLYNKATAPTSADTPIYTIGLPPGANVPIGDLISIFGIPFATGIGYAITGLSADADTTVIGAGDVLVNLSYI